MDTDNSVELNDPAGTIAPREGVAGEDCRHEGLPTPRRYLALAGVWLALIVSILDGSITRNPSELRGGSVLIGGVIAAALHFWTDA
jgi:hypothetical protein